MSRLTRLALASGIVVLGGYLALSPLVDARRLSIHRENAFRVYNENKVTYNRMKRALDTNDAKELELLCMDGMGQQLLFTPEAQRKHCESVVKGWREDFENTTFDEYFRKYYLQ